MNIKYLNFYTNSNINLNLDKNLSNKISFLIRTDFFYQPNFLLNLNDIISNNEVCWIIIIGTNASFWEEQVDELIENLSIGEIKYLDIVTVSYNNINIENINDIVYEFVEISSILNRVSLMISFLNKENRLDCMIENKIIAYLYKA